MKLGVHNHSLEHKNRFQGNVTRKTLVFSKNDCTPFKHNHHMPLLMNYLAISCESVIEQILQKMGKQDIAPHSTEPSPGQLHGSRILLSIIDSTYPGR